MPDPDNIVPEHLGAIRAELAEIKQQVATIARTLDEKADTRHVADVERKIDGLTHVVVSSLGSLVRGFEALDRRVARLEHAPA